jgi:adenylosuccinate lyase
MLAGLKFYGMVAAVVGVIGLVAYANHRYNSLTEQVTALQADNKTLRDNLVLVEEANKSNLLTIRRLQGDRKRAETAVQELKAVNEQDRKQLAELSDIISKQKDLPENQAALSPVLVDTLRRIEEERARRGR